VKEYLKKFLDFVVEKKWFFLWLLVCFLIDRVTTHIVLSSGQFTESNLTIVMMWNIFGYAWSEILTVIFVALVFFYIGVFGGQLTRKVVLPAFCLIYTWMMLGNVIVLMMVITGNYDCVSIFDWLSSINWYVYCFGLAIISIVIIWMIYWMKDRSNCRLH
jgi:hypothetical protein